MSIRAEKSGVRAHAPPDDMRTPFGRHPAACHSPVKPHTSLLIRHLGLVPYEPAWHEMRRFTAERTAATPDELWLLEHPPIYTLGQAGDARHLLCDDGIPLMHVDRGGQITYHGPGQVVAYLLLDLHRRALKVRELVSMMEQSVIELLADYGVKAERRSGAPGVYVCGAKLAALGLRVRRGCSYHGLSLNVDMDLSPFALINPCGYSGLAVTQLRNLGVAEPASAVAQRLARRLAETIEAATVGGPEQNGHQGD